MTKNDSNSDGTLNGDANAFDREAQGILGSTAIKLRAATARIVSEHFVEPVKERIPSEQEVFDGIRKAPGIVLKAIDAMWVSPPQELGDRSKPPASKPARQASAPPPGIESIWGLPVGGVEVMGAPGDRSKQKKNRDEDVTMDDILPVPPGW
jgi:hypothetical protein